MALVQYDETTDRGGNLLRDTVNALRGYFVRYRFALYVFREQSLLREDARHCLR